MTKWLIMSVALMLGVACKTAPGSEEKPKAPAKEGTVADVVNANKWTLASVNVRKGLISLCEGEAAPPGVAGRVIATPGGLAPAGTLVGGLQAADAEVSLEGEPAKLADLTVGMQVSVELAKDSGRVTKINAARKVEIKKTPATSVWEVKTVEPEKKSVTVTNETLGITLKDLEITESTRRTAMYLTPEGGLRLMPLDLEKLAERTPVGLEFEFDDKTGKFVVGSFSTATGKAPDAK
jgi:hypothetical protein